MPIKYTLDPQGFPPTMAHATDAGFDLRATKDGHVPARGVRQFGTGVHIEVPAGWEGHIRPRSSMFKAGIATDGTIDCGYSGEILVTLHNTTDHAYLVKRGDRIAQLVISPCFAGELELVEMIAAGERGDNGFGSTGR